MKLLVKLLLILVTLTVKCDKCYVFFSNMPLLLLFPTKTLLTAPRDSLMSPIVGHVLLVLPKVTLK